MKRAVQTIHDENNTELPLKKRTSSLFSIATVCEEDDNDRLNSSARLGNASNASSAVGLDLMETPKEYPVGEALTQGYLHSSAAPSLLSVTPQSLSCAEDSSTGTDDDEVSISPNNKCVMKPPLNPSSLLVRTTELEQRILPQKMTIHAEKAVASRTTATINSGNPDQGDYRTGIVFEAGSDHYDRHIRLHKERPLRVTSVMDALKKADNDIYDRCCVLGEDDSEPSAGAILPTSGSATSFLDDDDFLRVHLPGYMKRLDKLFDCNCCDDERLDREAEQYKSIYFTKNSLTEAKKAASSLCSLVENVVSNDLDNGFAVIRPPGHHAEPGIAGGYCIINNLAVAAAYAREKLGVRKVLIVDWDVHHGNGTQSIFLNDPNVLYFSAHRWHGGNFFPFLSNGGPTCVGMGEGVGFNINVGWTAKGMRDDEYLALWESLLMPVAREFQPDLILVSAGFDAADGDLGECHITPGCYGRLTRSLMTLDTPIVCALEGGYVRSVLGKCVTKVVQALLDRKSAQESKIEDDEDYRERGDANVLDTINRTAAKNIKATMAAHESYWKCLSY